MTTTLGRFFRRGGPGWDGFYRAFPNGGVLASTSSAPLRIRFWTVKKLAFGLLLTCLACTSDAERAARRADALLRGEETYRRLCQTRLSDGYVITYRLQPRPNVGYNDISPWPVVVPDSGALWIARESFTNEGANGSKRESISQRPTQPDSAKAVRIAQATAGPTARVHCNIPLGEVGAFVQMLGQASSAKGPTLGGIVIGVDGDRGAAVFRF